MIKNLETPKVNIYVEHNEIMGVHQKREPGSNLQRQKIVVECTKQRLKKRSQLRSPCNNIQPSYSQE